MVHLPRKFLWLLFLPAALLQGQITLDLSRKTISSDDTVDLILEMEGGMAPSIPEIPLPKGLSVVGTSHQESIINTRRSFSVRYTLRAEKPGSYEIGPFNLKGGQGQQEIPALTLTVTEPKVLRTTEDLFVTLESDLTEPLVHETVELTLTLYSRLSIADIKILDFPKDGFEISGWQEVRASPRQVNGVTYRVQRFAARLTPTQAGSLRLNPQFRVEVLEQREPYGMMFGTRSTRSLRLQLQNPLELTVSHPPEAGRPENYSGHLGSFRLRASVSPREVNVGDPVTLRVELTGSGSLQQALPPGLQESDDFKVYRPKLTSEEMGRDGSSGRKVIEQVVIPKHAGVEEIPALEFAYYDTAARAYRIASAGPFPLTILDSGDGMNPSAFSSLSPETLTPEPTVLGEDLIYLKTRPGKIRSVQQLQPGWTFTGLSGLPFALWALAGLYVHRREKQEEDQAALRQRQAPRRLRKHLQNLDRDERGDVYARIWSVLSEYLAARLNLPPGELNPRDALPRVREKLNAECFGDLESWMARCEHARFAGGAAEEDPMNVRVNFREFILRLDRELGR